MIWALNFSHNFQVTGDEGNFHADFKGRNVFSPVLSIWHSIIRVHIKVLSSASATFFLGEEKNLNFLHYWTYIVHAFSKWGTLLYMLLYKHTAVFFQDGHIAWPFVIFFTFNRPLTVVEKVNYWSHNCAMFY